MSVKRLKNLFRPALSGKGEAMGTKCFLEEVPEKLFVESENQVSFKGRAGSILVFLRLGTV